MSLVNFTKRVSSGETCQDVLFDFGSKDDDPLLAHGVILCFYSPVFAKLINDANNNRDSSHRIQIQVTDSNKKTYEALINGIYEGFMDDTSKTHVNKDLFQLVRKYQLSQDLVENLFSSSNIWFCLEFALASHDESYGSFLLPKCEKMLRINKYVYKDPKALYGIAASSIIHALKQKKLPLKKKEVREFIDLWKEANKDQQNLEADLIQIYKSSLMIWERDDPWQTTILNVTSADVAAFSIEYNPCATVDKVAEEASFVIQVEKQRISIHQSDSEPEMNLDSKSNLKELGLKEDDDVVVKLKKMLTFREMSGDEHQLDFKDDETVEDLKEKISEKLETTGKSVKDNHLALIKDKKQLEDGKTLLESGLRESSHISVVVGDRKTRIKRIVDVNIAAEEGANITASSTFSSHAPRNALPGGVNSYWCSSSSTSPSSWSVEFSEPKVIGRLKFTQYSSNISMSFRVEVGNDNQNWTTVFTKENENSPKRQECSFELDSHSPSKFCRISIDKMGGGHNIHLHKVIMNEVVWD